MFDIVPLPPPFSWAPRPGSSFRRLSWTHVDSDISNESTLNQNPPWPSLEDSMDSLYHSNALPALSQPRVPSVEQNSCSIMTGPLSPEPQNMLSSRPRPRKGHKKSRHGCYNCKRRKIKCPEDLPSCHNCTKIKLSCEYPSAQGARVQVVYAVQDRTCPQADCNLQSTPMVFKASDMRLFHHFIVNAYPHLPLGNESVWVRDIASFAHSYDFLLQALLGLAASHISMTSTEDMGQTALSYRVLAIRNLNAALSKSPESAAESDAILATCYALAFQSSYLGQSIEEFLTMLRGCLLVLNEEWGSKFGTTFKRLSKEGQLGFIEDRLVKLPLIDAELVEEARQSLEQVRHLCDRAIVREVHTMMFEIVELLSISSRAAYLKNRDLNTYLSLLPYDDFQSFISPSNSTAQILLAHFVAMHTLMAPIKSCEWQGRKMALPNRKTVFFVNPIASNVPGELKGYIEWPLRATGGIPGVPSYIERVFGGGWVLNGREMEGEVVHEEGPVRTVTRWGKVWKVEG